MTKQIELLSPAGDMERLKMSLAYGADAVYLAGNDFGMRAFAGNFTPDEVHDPAAARNVLRRQHHIDDIVPRDFVELCIDSRQSGVGGYDSWGARAEEGRTLWSNADHELGFTLVPGRVLSAERAAKYRYE